MRRTIVRCGSLTRSSSLARLSPAIIAGFSSSPSVGTSPPRRIRLEMSELDRRLENAGQQHPRIAHGLPAGVLPELVRDPLLNPEPLVALPQKTGLTA